MNCRNVPFSEHNSLSLQDMVNEDIEHRLKDQPKHQLIRPIHPEINFKYNSVNLLVGMRRSGKTYNVFREIAKLKYIDHDYDLLLYVTSNGDNDQTFKLWEPEINLQVAICSYDESLDIIQELKECNSKFNSNKQHARHIIIVYDDAMLIFNKKGYEYKTLFANSQFNATYFLCIQSFKGLPTEIKANIDSVWIFGSFNRQQFNYMFLYLAIPIDKEEVYELYQSITKQDALYISYSDTSLPEVKVVEK